MAKPDKLAQSLTCPDMATWVQSLPCCAVVALPMLPKCNSIEALKVYPCLQLLRGSRVMHNIRNGTDIARFLADASKEHMQEHLDNLR